MSVFVASLASGSNGNCYYIGNEHEAVLIDAGISCRETIKRMRQVGLSISKVKAIFISHEHSDHIKGVEVLSSRYQLPVYITQHTLQYSRLKLTDSLTMSFKGYEPVMIGSISIHPFLKNHDAIDPHSFMVSCNNINIGVFTDIGIPCAHLISHFKQCHAAFLETNYDERMLEEGRYPYHLKKRISGDKGHLSNRQALELFISGKPTFMTHLFLSHLSKDNNHPEIASAMFNEHAGTTKIIVASRYHATEVYSIGENEAQLVKAAQMALF